LELIERLSKEGLVEFAFIVERQVNFMKNVWPEMRKRLSSETIPRREYNHSVNIWNPQNYRKELVNGRWSLVSKENTFTTHSGVPFWRFWNLGASIYTLFNNCNFYLLAAFLWSGPLSIRALFKM